MMESLQLPLFLLNILLIIIDVSLGYHFTPRLLQGIGTPDVTDAAVRPTRRLLSIVVALYMFFNCWGYFQAQPGWLLAVLLLVVVDILLQNWLARRSTGLRDSDEDEE